MRSRRATSRPSHSTTQVNHHRDDNHIKFYIYTFVENLIVRQHNPIKRILPSPAGTSHHKTPLSTTLTTRTLAPFPTHPKDKRFVAVPVPAYAAKEEADLKQNGPQSPEKGSKGKSKKDKKEKGAGGGSGGGRPRISTEDIQSQKPKKFKFNTVLGTLLSVTLPVTIH